MFTEKFKIRAYELDTAFHLKVQHLFNFLIEVAANHAAELKFGAFEMIKHRLTWVLSRAHVQIDRYPLWRQEINIETWPALISDPFAIRDYRIRNDRNQEIGRATTSWMLMNFDTRRAVPLPDFLKEVHVSNRERAIDDPFEKLPLPEKAEFTRHFYIRLSDLDVNQHVYSVNYLEWALESMPESWLNSQRLSAFEINFRAESNFGDKVDVSSQEVETVGSKMALHVLHRQSDGRELARLRSFWVNR